VRLVPLIASTLLIMRHGHFVRPLKLVLCLRYYFSFGLHQVSQLFVLPVGDARALFEGRFICRDPRIIRVAESF